MRCGLRLAAEFCRCFGGKSGNVIKLKTCNQVKVWAETGWRCGDAQRTSFLVDAFSLLPERPHKHKKRQLFFTTLKGENISNSFLPFCAPVGPLGRKKAPGHRSKPTPRRPLGALGGRAPLAARAPRVPGEWQKIDGNEGRMGADMRRKGCR